MSLLAETLVDEWLNRDGFLTIRGLKDGVSEMDLLGVRNIGTGIEAWHVEVQASFRPIGYISPLPKDAVPAFAKARTSAKERPTALLKQCVVEWVEKKFTAASKARARDRTWPRAEWKFVFVHGVVREKIELDLIAEHGIRVIPLHQILQALEHSPGNLRGGAGTDVSEIVEYYAKHELRN